MAAVRKEDEMTEIEKIQEQLSHLPPEKQSEVLDFVTFLRQQSATTQYHPTHRSMRQHPAFGSWRGRKIDAVDYQRSLRSEWDGRV
jgi:hypothetical protein